MSLTPKQARYAQLVASGLDYHTAAIDAGCKTHDAARKFVADMAKRPNVQAHIEKLKTVQAPAVNREPSAEQHETPLEYLKSVFNDASGTYTPKEKISAAIALLPYTEAKVAPIGKKEGESDIAAERSKSGRFATLSNQGDMLSETYQ